MGQTQMSHLMEQTPMSHSNGINCIQGTNPLRAAR